MSMKCMYASSSAVRGTVKHSNRTQRALAFEGNNIKYSNIASI